MTQPHGQCTSDSQQGKTSKVGMRARKEAEGPYKIGSAVAQRISAAVVDHGAVGCGVKIIMSVL